MRLNSKVTNARWDEDDQQWHVKVQKTDQPNTTIEDKAHILINAGGVLKSVTPFLPTFDKIRIGMLINRLICSNWKWPAIPGREKFEGPMLHSADWDDGIRLEGKRVAVIGSGSSAVQIVPNIRPGLFSSEAEIYFQRPNFLFQSSLLSNVLFEANPGSPLASASDLQGREEPTSSVNHSQSLAPS